MKKTYEEYKKENIELIAVFTDEAIAEVERKLNDPTYYLDPRGGFMYSAMTEIVDRVIKNITA